MSSFTRNELAQMSISIDLLTQKVNIGYNNAILRRELPKDLLSNREAHIFFVRAVNDFNRIIDVIVNNKPDDLSEDDWNEIAYLCYYAIHDLKNAGGALDFFITPLDHFVNVILKNKRREIFGDFKLPDFI